MARNEARMVVEEVTNHDNENGAVRARREHFDRNSAWLQSHATEVYSRHRGKCICVAGEMGRLHPKNGRCRERGALAAKDYLAKLVEVCNDLL